MLAEPVTGTADVRKSGSTLAINSLDGSIAQSRFSGWASLDFADKPLVKMDLAFSGCRLPPSSPAPIRGRPRPALERQGGQPGWAEFRRRRGAALGRRVRASTASASRRSRVGAILEQGRADGRRHARPASMAARSGHARGRCVGAREPSHALRLDLIGVQALPLLYRRRELHRDRRPHAGEARCARRAARARAPSCRPERRGRPVGQGRRNRSVNIAKMIRAVGASIVERLAEGHGREDRPDASSARSSASTTARPRPTISAARPAGAGDRRRHRRSRRQDVAVPGRAEAGAEPRRAGRRRPIRSASACRSRSRALGLAAHLSGDGRHPGQSRRGLCQAEGAGAAACSAAAPCRRSPGKSGLDASDLDSPRRRPQQEQSGRLTPSPTPRPASRNVAPTPPPQARRRTTLPATSCKRSVFSR